MLFNSIEFLGFLAGAVVLHAALPRSLRWVWLLVASYAFYMRWNPLYALLLVAATGIHFFGALAIARADSPARRRGLLVASVSAGLGLLFVFKYWNFAHANLDALAARVGFAWPLDELDLLLPVGISFFTFQTIGYTVDVYRGVVAPERSLGRFALYVSFFPQLVAGPIERASHLLPQLGRGAPIDIGRLRSGLELCLWGLFKKVVIADRAALYVDLVYANPGVHKSGSLLLATYLFAFQIYCDFSGYTDIARGAARIFGIDLMENFHTPYLARDLADFWHRWHISLSTWLRDYLYIPLGGNRRGTGRTYANLIVTMVLGGLWHGASWNFVLWGGLHGGALALGRATRDARRALLDRLGTPTWLSRTLGTITTFHVVCLGWVFFRADDLSTALAVLHGLAGPLAPPEIAASTLAHAAVGLAILAAVELYQASRSDAHERLASAPPALRWALAYAGLFALALLGVEAGSQFIYFQF